MTGIAACIGKVAFDDWDQAERAAKRRRRSAEADLHPYRCKVCHKVHVGSDRGVRNKRKAERALTKAKG